MKFKDYRTFLIKELQDEDFAVGYLTEVLAEESPDVFLIALRDVMDARKEKVANLAKATGLTRQGIYRALSKDGNPRFKTITEVLNNLGLQLTLRKKVSPKKKPRKRGGERKRAA